MNGFTLKLIAMATMLIDHVAAVLIPVSRTYEICRIVGRLAFPIYCFLLVEGFFHTKNVKKYLMSMGIFALISEIPFDLAFSNKTIDMGFLYSQNVFFTLFIGLTVICLMSIIEKKYVDKVFLGNVFNTLVVIAGCAVSILLYTDYTYFGILLIVAFYVFRGNKGILTFVVFLLTICLGLYLEGYAFISMLFIWRYNGKRGPQGNKYIFYAFYPVHILVIYLISLLPMFH
jgi:hypothetical protein